MQGQAAIKAYACITDNRWRWSPSRCLGRLASLWDKGFESRSYFQWRLRYDSPLGFCLLREVVLLTRRSFLHACPMESGLSEVLCDNCIMLTLSTNSVSPEAENWGTLHTMSSKEYTPLAMGDHRDDESEDSLPPSYRSQSSLSSSLRRVIYILSGLLIIAVTALFCVIIFLHKPATRIAPGDGLQHNSKSLLNSSNHWLISF